MNRWIVCTVWGSVVTLGAGLVLARPQQEHGGRYEAKKDATPAQAKCPVMDEPVNLAVSTATDDGPVYFCCKGCIAKYRAKPAKYAAKVAGQRKALAGRSKVQVTCPVSGEPVDQKVFTAHDSGKVYFCCKDCISKFQTNPEVYKAALANSYTYQTKCPVMDEDIDPKAAGTLASGLTIYYCCKGCDKKFLKNPSKYAPNLEVQGFAVNPADMKPATNGEHRDEHDHGSQGHGDHDHGHGG